MNRRRWLAGGVAVGAVAAGVGVALRRSDRPSTEAGDIPWTTPFRRPDGSMLTLAGYRGAPLLLNFWATWCPPCVTELPLLDRFFVEKRMPRWQVVGLAIDQVEPVKEFIALHPITYPVAVVTDDGLALARRLGNAAGALPFSVAVDSTGSVAARKLGVLSEAELASWRDSIH